MSVAPPRPSSSVSTGVGIAGLAGFFIWIVIILATGVGWVGELGASLGIERIARDPAAYAALGTVIATGIPMILWSVFVDRVYANPSTGIDWSAPHRDDPHIRDVSITKLCGLWVTWALIAAVYCIARWYWRGNYLFAMELFASLIVPLVLVSIPYVVWLDKRLIEPRDGAWHLGAWLTGQDGVDNEAIYAHLRSWAVKGFFLAFMISIVPGGFRGLLSADFALIQTDPVALAIWLINLMFVVDVAFATVGYALTLKPLDSHIRSAMPYAAGWTAALICYPPFALMYAGGPLDHHFASAEWNYWLAANPAAMTVMGFVLVILTGLYAWATVAFGLRFSNLTHRGIITHGPYAWTKHPAYLAKNTFWWLALLPFLTTNGSLVDAIRNTVILAVISGVYYWRGKTEERHLSEDPAYREYAAWMAEHGVITRLFTRRRGGTAMEPQAAE
jgi:protein-S-isoprenylcysteine O-methyltransferase Ste14